MERMKRLGALIRQRRSALGISVIDAAQRAGISRQQWTKIEAGEAMSPRPQTLGRVELALSWPPGSIEVFLEIGDEPRGDVWPPAVVVDVQGLEARERLLADVRRELTNDEKRELRRQLMQVLIETDE